MQCPATSIGSIVLEIPIEPVVTLSTAPSAIPRPHAGGNAATVGLYFTPSGPLGRGGLEKPGKFCRQQDFGRLKTCSQTPGRPIGGASNRPGKGRPQDAAAMNAQKGSPPSELDEGGLGAIAIRVLPGALPEENGTWAAGWPNQPCRNWLNQPS